MRSVVDNPFRYLPLLKASLGGIQEIKKRVGTPLPVGLRRRFKNEALVGLEGRGSWCLYGGVAGDKVTLQLIRTHSGL